MKTGQKNRAKPSHNGSLRRSANPINRAKRSLARDARARKLSIAEPGRTITSGRKPTLKRHANPDIRTIGKAGTDYLAF